MTLRRGVVLGTVVLVLAGAFAAMVVDAVQGGDWPGWDEGWAVVAFPLGIPAAVAAGLAVAERMWRASPAARVALVSAAVWCWGALLFLGWLAAG